MQMIIDASRWHVCKICQKEISSITQEYSRPNKYKTDYFMQHLQDVHAIDIDSYFDIDIKCPCGVCNKTLKVKKNGANFFLKKFACGRNDGVVRWSEQAKSSRLGPNNPMYKAIPWNKGLNKQNSEYGSRMSLLISNRKVSISTKEKQAESARKRIVHGHTGFKHSEQAKEKMRKSTLEMISRGMFPQTNTVPCKKFESLLIEIGYKYSKEYVLQKWCFDFYLIDYNIFIEVDGDYFHSNPIFYPNGPKTKTQKINYRRDLKKNKFCEQHNVALIRVWENEIIGDIECVRQRLLDLKK